MGKARANRCCGLIGYPVHHSPSPELHGRFARALNLQIRYELLEATKKVFKSTVQEFFYRGGVGLNITLPHKVAALALADVSTVRAREAGAANLLRGLNDGTLLADNTDGAGFLRDLRQNLHVDLTGIRVLMAGAGGAARGILSALLQADVRHVVIVNRDPRKGAELAAQRPKRVAAMAYKDVEEGREFDLLVNATSSSLTGQMPPFPSLTFDSHVVAYDLVYSSKPTPFMKWALASGVGRALDGWGMLVEQAAESFYLWHGVWPDTSPFIERRS